MYKLYCNIVLKIVDKFEPQKVWLQPTSLFWCVLFSSTGVLISP